MKTYDTVLSAREAVISIAKKYLHVTEGSTLHHKIIDTYNAITPRPRSYKVTYNDAWCATFVTFVFDQAGLSDLIYRECGCQDMINGLKKKGIVRFNKYSEALKGDIIFYDWNLDNHADHVGIITSINTTSKEITVIEGNKSDAVGYRVIPITSNFIQCIASPKYEDCAKETDVYANLGWNKDSTGWWYAYAHSKGSYYRNSVEKINGKMYIFDWDGYLCDGANTTFNEDGSIISIMGKKLAL